MFGTKFHQILSPLIVSAALVFGAAHASAHVIAIGYTAGANAGDVNLWLGSYHTYGQGDGPDLEGSARLQGLGALSAYDTTTAFTYSEGTDGNSIALPPSGLVLGTNLFTSVNYGGSSTSQSALNDIYSWEAATLTGLSAGDYVFTYVPIANPSAHWAPWNDLDNITLTLTASDKSGGGTTAGTPCRNR
jgi:hypothetical protein